VGYILKIVFLQMSCCCFIDNSSVITPPSNATVICCKSVSCLLCITYFDPEGQCQALYSLLGQNI
jgi:hypothetical protein